MNLDPQYIRLFPSHQDVFIGDMRQYEKHFLPICSLNLKAIDPNEDQWVHFVSVNEIYDGCVGQETYEFHTEFCKEDMLGFNVIGDKYQFDASWDYFVIESNKQKPEVNSVEVFGSFRQALPSLHTSEDLDAWFTAMGDQVTGRLANTILFKFKFLTSSKDTGLIEATLDRMQKKLLEEQLNTVEGAYELNKDTFQVIKSYYQKHQHIYPLPPGNYDSKVSTLEALENKVQADTQYDYPEFFGVLDDIAFQSKEEQEFMQEYKVSLEEMKSFENTNLIHLPQEKDGNVFNYVGRFTGYLFQCFGADSVYLFYNKDLKKAVISLEYT